MQQCYLESVADMTYVAVTKCHFWNRFSKFWIENENTSGPEAMGGHRGSKRRSKSCFKTPKTTQNYRSKQGLHSDLLHILSSYFIFQPCDDWRKNNWVLCKLENAQSTYLNNLSRFRTRVSVQGVKSFDGHFACLCGEFGFYEVKKKFQKDKGNTFTLYSFL